MSIIDCYVLVPLAKKLTKILPLWLPANIITIISNGFVFLAAVIALTARRTNWPIWILIPFLFIFYLIGDTADGLQARRTKTGSPLGEFCDHFLDTFVTGELLFCVLTAYGVRNLLFVGILLYVSYFTQMAAFWEKYVTSKLHLGIIYFFNSRISPQGTCFFHEIYKYSNLIPSGIQHNARRSDSRHFFDIPNYLNCDDTNSHKEDIQEFHPLSDFRLDSYSCGDISGERLFRHCVPYPHILSR